MCHDGQFFLCEFLLFAELADAQATDIFSFFVIPKGFQGVRSYHGIIEMLNKHVLKNEGFILEDKMEYFHLTTPQQNIWNLQKYYKGTAIANLCGAVFFQEKRDEALLCRAICRFIRSQSGIRLRFHEGEEPGQYVSEEVNEDIPVRTFRTREEFDAYAETCAKDPIGLSERQMYRFVVFHLEQENRSGILAVLSHLISDAWTFGLMANQLDAEYRRLAGRET